MDIKTVEYRCGNDKSGGKKGMIVTDFIRWKSTGMYGSVTVCLRRHVEWMTADSQDTTRRGATDEDLRENTWVEKSPVKS